MCNIRLVPQENVDHRSNPTTVAAGSVCPAFIGRSLDAIISFSWARASNSMATDVNNYFVGDDELSNEDCR